MISLQNQIAILQNRINTLEGRGKATQSLINSLKREVRKLERKLEAQ